jgi:alkanesulfonate monooxygenase SsuD/methylene tetrahydromethanopterin reductase-like flavin-dependent oxidoreductase (luciferase family)
VLPGFGHGVDFWMRQIGAAPQSTMQSLRETVTVVRRLLNGEQVTFHGTQVHLEAVQMSLCPATPPPLYVGAMRERTLHLAGRIGDGTILTGMSGPAYVEWALAYIRAGMDEAQRTHHRVAVYYDVKVHPDGAAARAATRRALAARMPWPDVQVQPLGIAAALDSLMQTHGSDVAEHIPDAWLDTFAAAGTPEQAADAIRRLFAAGADTVIFQPLNGDPECLDEYARYLMPRL